eukprot:TRINITY_DN3588_c0_g1_i1.p1 TRINITY_DN3588_c0_g1~~TRINITY_DN3588_c0_g1_i1.p1  ORF type:complete len:477 (-),score=39.26 TRINITY_DN3588_c0_g1_i1:120-1550(-)
MRLVFTLINCGVVTLAWRKLSQCHKNGAFPLQEKLHSFRKPLPLVLQWYSIMLLALIFLSTMVAVGINEQLELTNWLDADIIESRFLHNATRQDVVHRNTETRADLRMGALLKTLSLWSPFAGALTAVIVFIHAMIILKSGQSYELDEGYSHNMGDEIMDSEKNPWRVSERQDMVLILIFMPWIYAVMSVRSTSRMWSIMTLEHVNAAASLDFALFTENLECASIFAYYVVMEFVRLCNSVIKTRASFDIRWAMRFAGFQGVYAWVIVGIVKAVLSFGTAFLGIRPELVRLLNMDETTLEVKTAEIQGKISVVFSVLTMICVYNMVIICKLKYLKDTLGNANGKFLGVRLLLLAGQVQEKALSFMVTHNDAWPFTILNLSEKREMLLHSTLLSYECLFVALFNIWAWEIDLPIKQKLHVNIRFLRNRLIPDSPEEEQYASMRYTCRKCKVMGPVLDLDEHDMKCAKCGSPSCISAI